MLQIKSLKGKKFRDAKGVFEYPGRQFALCDDEGYISLDGGKTIYTPQGGRKALQSIIDMGGFSGEVAHISPIN